MVMLVVAVTDAEGLHADYWGFQYDGHQSNDAAQQRATSSVISTPLSVLINYVMFLCSQVLQWRNG